MAHFLFRGCLFLFWVSGMRGSTDKEKLLSVYDETKDKEPMRSEELGGTV